MPKSFLKGDLNKDSYVYWNIQNVGLKVKS